MIVTNMSGQRQCRKTDAVDVFRDPLASCQGQPYISPTSRFTRGGPMSRPSGILRSFAAALGIAVATTLAVATPGGAVAQPAAQNAPTVVARHTVTLLTGDVVELSN